MATAATSSNNEPTSPLIVGFESEVELTIHGAYLQTARLLQCDPVAHVSIATLQKITTTKSDSNVSSNANNNKATLTSITASERPVASTRRLYFTSKPVFNETLRFVVPHNNFLYTGDKSRRAVGHKNTTIITTGVDDTAGIERNSQQRILITIEDAQSRVYGQAACPFLPFAPSVSKEPVRVMLQPRNTHDRHDPMFQMDVAALTQHGVDDFGFITISWRVSLRPHGGALITAPPQNILNAQEPPVFPLGLVLRATWLVPGHTYQRGTRYTTSVEFGGHDRFVFDGANPLFLTIQNATQLQRAIVHCTIQNMIHQANSHEVAVVLPVPPLASFAMERDLWWTAAVRTHRGGDLGLLLASIRLVRRPLDGATPMCSDERCSRINDPQHQAQFTHVARDWGALVFGNNNNNNSSSLPDVPPGAYQPIFWESEQHMARAKERRWRRDCITEASPTPEHVRHLLDVILARASLDPGVARVAAVFFNQSSSSRSPQELRQLLVSSSFHAKGMSPQEASRFCFFALRRDMEQAIAKEDVIFILENSLIGKTVDMPEGEVRRRVMDIFGDSTYVIFDDFVRYFIHNYAMWYAFGVPIMADSISSTCINTTNDVIRNNSNTSMGTSNLNPIKGIKNEGGQTTNSSSSNHNNNNNNAAGVTGIRNTSTPANTNKTGVVSNDDGMWRTFIARVQHSNKAFSVTAHINDTIADVMVMVQNSTGIRAACQEWRANGIILDPKLIIGNTELGLSRSEGAVEVTIIARDEAVRLTMIYREKGFRWEVRVPANEKVLKLRALVQQKTMIPLSRCVLQARGVCLMDRHTIMHYQLQDGDLVYITQE